jgi:hypothetical protein
VECSWHVLTYPRLDFKTSLISICYSKIHNYLSFTLEIIYYNFRRLEEETSNFHFINQGNNIWIITQRGGWQCIFKIMISWYLGNKIKLSYFFWHLANTVYYLTHKTNKFSFADSILFTTVKLRDNACGVQTENIFPSCYEMLLLCNELILSKGIWRFYMNFKLISLCLLWLSSYDLFLAILLLDFLILLI